MVTSLDEEITGYLVNFPIVLSVDVPIRSLFILVHEVDNNLSLRHLLNCLLIIFLILREMTTQNILSNTRQTNKYEGPATETAL